MSENPSLDKPAPEPHQHPAPPFGDPLAQAQPPTPAGYDQPVQPAAPDYAQPSHQQPMDQAPPAYQSQPYQQGYQSQPYQQGYQQPAYAQPYGEQKSKVAAGILGILLGGLGIHNFYLGYTKKALIQLLVSVLSVGILAWAMAIWGLVEGILILVGNDGFRTDARGIPLKD